MYEGAETCRDLKQNRHIHILTFDKEPSIKKSNYSLINVWTIISFPGQISAIYLFEYCIYREAWNNHDFWLHVFPLKLMVLIPILMPFLPLQLWYRIASILFLWKKSRGFHLEKIRKISNTSSKFLTYGQIGRPQLLRMRCVVKYWNSQSIIFPV